MYCNLPALGGNSAYSTISPSLHICVASTSSQAHRTHNTSRMTQLEPYSHQLANRSAGRFVRSSDSPPCSIRQLHYHLGMLPFQERTRLTEEGTMQTTGRITQIDSKAGQIAGGGLRWMEGYLGKIPCIKESLYPCKRTIYLCSFPYTHISRLFSKNTLTG